MPFISFEGVEYDADKNHISYRRASPACTQHPKRCDIPALYEDFHYDIGSRERDSLINFRAINLGIPNSLRAHVIYHPGLRVTQIQPECDSKIILDYLEKVSDGEDGGCIYQVSNGLFGAITAATIQHLIPGPPKDVRKFFTALVVSQCALKSGHLKIPLKFFPPDVATCIALSSHDCSLPSSLWYGIYYLQTQTHHVVTCFLRLLWTLIPKDVTNLIQGYIGLFSLHLTCPQCGNSGCVFLDALPRGAHVPKQHEKLLNENKQVRPLGWCLQCGTELVILESSVTHKDQGIPSILPASERSEMETNNVKVERPNKRKRSD
jgi:hypothetical protein